MSVLKCLFSQKAYLDQKQQEIAYENLIQLQDLVQSLVVNRLKAPIAYDSETISTLKKFHDFGALVLQRYSKFIGDKHNLRELLQQVIDTVEKYLELIKDDNFYRRTTGSDWLPSRIDFDSEGVITTELRDEGRERLLNELKLFLSIKKPKSESTMTLSQTDVASLILRDHFSRQLRALKLWEQIKKREGIE